MSSEQALQNIQPPKTPVPKPENYPQFLGETPRSARSQSKKNVTPTRPAMVADMRSEMIVVRTIDDFRKNYMRNLPPADESEINLSVSALKDAGAIQPKATGPLRWKAFTKAAFKKTGRKAREKAIFNPLTEYVDIISRAVGEKRKMSPTYKLDLEPDRTYMSSISGATHKMDGSFIAAEEETQKKKLPPMTSVALCTEWKKGISDETVAINRAQLLADSNFLINNDPRRQFVFGLTIEGPNCSLWYFSRSHSAMSTSFDWTTDIRTFLDILITLAFATPAQLGFDPTITLVPHSTSGLESFVYEVVDTETKAKRFFHTQRSISELRSICITGRATRVWEVVEIDSVESMCPVGSAKAKVLKDVWLEADSKTERVIVREICADVEKFKGRMDDDPPEFDKIGPEMKQRMRSLLVGNEYKRHFLTIACDSLGEKSSSVPEDRGSWERDPNLFEHLPPDELKPATAPGADTTRSGLDHSHPVESHKTSPPKEDYPDREFSPKRRCFTVFEEVCEASHSLKTLKDTVNVLRDGLFGLFILFVAGWVHRDVSSGNILHYKPSGSEDGRGILSDLEYAKRFPSSGGSADPKTGTAFFMADEIIFGAMVSAKEFHAVVVADDLPGPSRKPHSEDTKKSTDHPRHNFLHDLESLWWIFLWILTSRLPYTDRSLMEHVFVNCINPPSQKRHTVFSRENHLQDELWKNLDESVKPLTPVIDGLRRSMVASYRILAPPKLGAKQDDDPKLTLECMKYKSEISHFYKLLYQMFFHALAECRTAGETLPSLRPLVNPATANERPGNKVDQGVAVQSGKDGRSGANTEGGKGKKRAREGCDSEAQSSGAVRGSNNDLAADDNSATVVPPLKVRRSKRQKSTAS